MNKQEALNVFRLLSALESWSFSTGKPLPDYLHEDLCSIMAMMEKIVLEKS